MIFLAPWALVAAGAASAVVVALHFLARHRPRPALLPTARFVPESSARAPARSVRPTDPMLLALRVLALMLVGTAFARPVPAPRRRVAARVVVLDRSASARSEREGRDSAAALLRAGDVLVTFDSAARVVRGAARDSLAALPASAARGSLSAALAAAARAAAPLRERADSVELVLVSPFAREEWDDATPAIRGVWTGRARLVRIAAARAPAPAGRIDVVGAAPGDPVRATVALLGGRGGGAGGGGGAEARIDRGVSGGADDAWARGAGRVLVRWPARVNSARARAETVGAVVAGDAALVAPLERGEAPPAGGRVIARWVDGAPAAVERAVGEGCVRDVAISMPARGDVALRDGARALVRTLTEPCGGARATDVLSDSALAVLRGGTRLMPASALPPLPARPSRAATWLLAGAAALLLIEPLARRGGGAP